MTDARYFLFQLVRSTLVTVTLESSHCGRLLDAHFTELRLTARLLWATLSFDARITGRLRREAIGRSRRVDEQGH
jgi:hypothetical protein